VVVGAFLGKYERSVPLFSFTLHTAHMQGPGPYDFDFGTLERMPQDCFHLICARMMVPVVTPQQLYFAQLMKVSNVISEAREHESGHGEYDWAEFLLNVDTFQEFSWTLFNEYEYPSGSPI
jgi:hypothetical protein